jgi:hypothetical protein
MLAYGAFAAGVFGLLPSAISEGNGGDAQRFGEARLQLVSSCPTCSLVVPLKGAHVAEAGFLDMYNVICRTHA